MTDENDRKFHAISYLLILLLIKIILPKTLLFHQICGQVALTALVEHNNCCEEFHLKCNEYFYKINSSFFVFINLYTE